MKKIHSAQSESGVPEGQGSVPWHRISDFRITDALVARINYSSGNLMLASTSFDIAGVGQNLQFTQTYNSLEGPHGRASTKWWLNYERWLVDSGDEAVIYDKGGEALRFTQTGTGYTTPEGFSKDLKKSSDGTWTLTDRRSGSKDTYNSNGTLTKVTDKNKGEIRVEQNSSGGFKITDSRSGRWIDFTQVTEGLRWEAKDHTGRTVRYDLDGYDNLRALTDTAGKKTSFDYDSSHRITKITTADGRATLLTYDAASRVTSMLRSTNVDGGHTGPTYLYTYSQSGLGVAGTTTVTDPLGQETKYEHTADGEVTRVVDDIGKERSSTYDANHNVSAATDAMGSGSTPGNETTYGWDARNNPTSAALPTGATSAMTGYQTIAGTDLPGSMKMPDGETTKFTYDTAGNTTSVAVTGSGGGTRDFVYNKSSPSCGGFEGQACSVEDERDKRTNFTYDTKGSLVKAAPPSPLGATSYTYDDLGRPLSVTDGRGIKVTYTYDSRDRVVKVAGPNATVVYTYDGDGNLIQRVDGTGTTKYAFDPLSRETVRTLQDGSQTVLTYTADGNVESYEDPAGKTRYAYDDIDRLTTLTPPDGKATTYKYSRNDRRTHTIYPGGTQQVVTLDESDRPTKIKSTSSKGTLVDLSYTYSYGTGGTDGTKIRTITDAVAGTKRTHSYTSSGRFSWAKETKGSATNNSWQYCYDAAGNLTSQGITEGCPRGTTYKYNDAGQLTHKNESAAGWSYDKAGNETAGASETPRTNETWSDFSQLTSLTTRGTTRTGQYASTDNSERVALGDTLFHHGPIGLAATTSAGQDTGFIREAPGTLNSMNRGGKSYYYLTDALGSTVAMVDAAGKKTASYYYSPRGVTDAAEDGGTTQPYRFAGSYQDPTELYAMGARYYDNRTGRFTQPDPSGKERNPYLYAEGDPVNRIDPDGLLSMAGVADALGPIGDVATGGVHLAQGNTRALWGDVAGVLAGGLAGAGCGFAVGASAAPTLGGSLGAATGCYAVSWSAGQIASNAVGG